MISTTHNEPNPALIGPYLIGQRVEVKTRIIEQIGVVTWVNRAEGLITLSEPGVYLEEAGRWTHRNRRWAHRVEEIERLTVLEGPARMPEEEEPRPRRARSVHPRYDLIKGGKLRSV